MNFDYSTIPFSLSSHLTPLLSHSSHHLTILLPIFYSLHVFIVAVFNWQLSVFDFMDTDLSKIIRSNQYMTTGHIQFILYQILLAIKYMHSANVIHRDLKRTCCRNSCHVFTTLTQSHSHCSSRTLCVLSLAYFYHISPHQIHHCDCNHLL